MSKGRIQNEDIKSESELIDQGGAKSQLINDDKLYISALGSNKTLKEAIEDGDLSKLIERVGGELNQLSFKVRSIDEFRRDPAIDTTLVDTSAGRTDETLYSRVGSGDQTKGLYRLSYDADKTVTGTTTSMQLSATPAITVQTGDLLIVGNEARRIETLGSINSDGGSGTPFTIESTFTSDPSASACNVSQAWHSVDLNNFSIAGSNSPNSIISDDINQVLSYYEDTETLSDVVPDFGVTPHIAFQISTDGASWSDLLTRPQDFSDLLNLSFPPTANTNLYLRFFANKTSGTGAVNLLKVEAYWHRESDDGNGGILDQAYGLTDNSVASINGTIIVFSGKTRINLNFGYAIGTNLGEAQGDLIVELDGKNIYRINTVGQPFYNEIDDNTIELDQDYSGSAFRLVVRRVSGTIDNRDLNTNRIAGIETFNQTSFRNYISKSFITAIDGAPSASQFRSEVVGRAPIIDLSNDLLSRQAVNRIHVQRIKLIENEFGPSNEPVFSIVNDKFDQIRVVGQWDTLFSTSGVAVRSKIINNFIEITFYGTGLNALIYSNATARDVRATVDGGSEGSNFIKGDSPVLTRNYNANINVNVVSGLSLGLHTVKLRDVNSNFEVYGFEILNESSNLITNPGNSFINTTKVSLGLQDSQSYNSTFESGTLAAKGGQVLVYLKSDGTVKKSVTPTEASQLNLGSADHTNEEIVRKINFREFGSGRSDDFSTLEGTSSDRAFTLEDGSTTLVGDDTRITSNLLDIVAINDFLLLIFIGTGLNLIGRKFVAGTIHTYEIFVNGNSIGNLSDPGENLVNIPIVSGLPYGTHTCKIELSVVNSQALGIQDFIIYQPKKPTLPSNSIELSSYNIMADFVANSVAGLDTISTGTLRKSSSREFIYTNGTGGTSDWTLTFAVIDKVGAFEVLSDRLNAIFQYTFFGTGFDLRFRIDSGRATTITVRLNGTTLTAANFPTASFNTYGTGASFNSTTGVLDQQDAGTVNGAGFVVSGLFLNTYVVEFDNGVVSENIDINTLDIITPIHSYKSNLPFNLQNTLPIGSQGILDLRKFSPLKREIISLGSTSTIKINTSNTTSISFVPLPEMSVVIKTNGNPVEVSATLKHSNNSIDQGPSFQIIVDGISLSDISYITQQPTANKIVTLSFSRRLFLARRTHTITINWNTGGGTTSTVTQGTLDVQEISNNKLLEE